MGVVVSKSVDAYNKESYVGTSHLFRGASWLSEEVLRSGRGKKHKKDMYLSSPAIHKMWEKINRLTGREPGFL